MLKDKKILIGVTGSIAACKVSGLVKLLEERGAVISVLSTESGERFLKKDEFAHINLGKDHDLILIAPCTANTLSKIAHGICDNLLTQTVLAASCPVLIAPAMNTKMLENPLTKKSIKKLKESNYKVLDTEAGMLACGDKGKGRMLAISKIAEKIEDFFLSQDLSGKNILITGGATREKIDQVRFISNYSSGKMALALTQEALDRGAEVVFVKGCTDHLEIPFKAKVVEVESALDMLRVAKEHLEWCDFFVSAAAVCDFKPVDLVSGKIKKSSKQPITFTQTKDVLKEIPKSKSKKYIGFALETEKITQNATKKLKEKNLDLIVANTPATFGSDYISPILISKTATKKFSKMTKSRLAREVFDAIL
jgi:phosphopantothenoylcysteine decarboxylase / phosphopantothenate---cysteine ligase